MNESETKLRQYVRNRLEEHAGIKKSSLNENKKSNKLQKLDRMIDKQFNLYESEAKKNINEAVNEVFGFSVGEKLAKIDPQNAQGVEELFGQAFKNILSNPRMGAIGRAAQNTSPEAKYNILQQFVDGKGGTLRLVGDGDSVEFASQDVKNAAVRSKFGQGGTQGKTTLGGV